MTDQTTNFLGIPVHGDITRSDRKDQRPLEEFQPILQAVLDDPTIVEFGWRQYTPYFNDGDTCTFSAHGLWVRTNADEPEEYARDLDFYGHPTLGQMTGGEWVDNPDGPGRKKVGEQYEGPDEARYLRCRALYQAVDHSEFDDVLLDAFGDHAEVTVRRDGIEVEFYEHD